MEKFIKLTPIEHVLARPGMYIGSVAVDTVETWVLEAAECEDVRIVKRPVQYNAGLYKIFDEILVNAADNKQRDP